MQPPVKRRKRRPKPDHHSRNVRPGKATGIKPTAKDYGKRVQQCIELLALRRTRHEIIAAMTAEYGVHWQTVDRYLLRAREVMLERSQRPKRDHIADAFSLYENVIKDPMATRKERLQAQDGLNDLLGLRAPRRTEISGPDEGPIEIEGGVTEGLDLDHLDDLLRQHYNGKLMPDARFPDNAGKAKG